MTAKHDPLERQLKSRTEAQKARRRELWLARAPGRRAQEETALRRRYEELTVAMAKLGVRIGTIADLADRHEDPVRRVEVLKARMQRWEAIWAVTLRKRMTRGKIVLGGAVLAELGELVMEDASDRAFQARVIALLDRRVPRVHDRVVLKGLLTGEGGPGTDLPLRPGGPLDEPIDQALAAVGERHSTLDGGRATRGEESFEADDEETSEAEAREGRVEWSELS